MEGPWRGLPEAKRGNNLRPTNRTTHTYATASPGSCGVPYAKSQHKAARIIIIQFTEKERFFL